MTPVRHHVDAQPTAGAQPGVPAPRTHWPYWWAAVVAGIGVLVTAGLIVTALLLNAGNERHLLNLRAKEVGAALTAAVPETQTPLGAAAELANATGARSAKLRRFAAPYVGTGAGRPFVSLSIWRSADPAAGPVVIVGAPPELAPASAATAAFLRRAATGPGLSVTGLLSGAHPRLGYAYSGAGRGRYLAYGESALPAGRYTRLPPTSAYADLDVAVYLGRPARRSDLLLTTVRALPLPGRRATAIVPFGDTVLTVVVAARQPLGGAFPQDLPWAIGAVGALLTLGASLLTARLLIGRRQAQQLAAENRRLYSEQRGIAQTLQHALLPDVLPRIPGLELTTRYEPGENGVEIGGDWYDLIDLDDDRLLLVIGDVSGRGLKAATAMASLRFAIHFAAYEQPPEVFLPKLSGMRRLREAGMLATVLCAVIELPARQVTITNAGHLPLLLVANGDSRYLETKVGLPLGVDDDAHYEPATFALPAGATLLAYTDGLVERRTEVLDDGLERLRRLAAAEASDSLDDLVAEVLARVRGPESIDDTAIAGVRWMS